MRGMDQDGRGVDHTPIVTQDVPRGPLAPHQVRDYQQQVISFLELLGLNRHQARQVVKLPRNTLYRRMSDHVPSGPLALASAN